MENLIQNEARSRTISPDFNYQVDGSEGVIRYQLSHSQYGEFWNSYCDTARKNDYRLPFAVSEKKNDVHPLTISFDLLLDTDEDDNDYPFQLPFVIELLHKVEMILYQCFDNLEESRLYSCVLLEDFVNDGSSKNLKYIDGSNITTTDCVVRVTFQFPNLAMKSEEIVDVLKRKFTSSSLSSPELNKIVPDMQRILASSIVNLENSVHELYGSRFDGNTRLNRFVGAFTYLKPAIISQVRESNYDVSFIRLNVVNTFCPRDHRHISDYNIEVNSPICEQLNEDNIYSAIPFDEDEYTLYYLPIILSYSYNSVMISVSRNSVQEETDTSTNRLADPAMPHKYYNFFLKMISNNRRSKRVECQEIGRAIYNACHNTVDNSYIQRGKRDWLAFAQYDCYDNMISDWYSFNDTQSVTIKTLAWYAKIDSPDKYQRWHYSWVMDILERNDFDFPLPEQFQKKMTSLTDEKVCEMFYRYYWLELLATGDKIIWYRFIPHNHHWIRVEGDIDVQSCFTYFKKNFIVKAISRKSSDYSSQNEDEQKRTSNIMSILTNMIKNIETQTYLKRYVNGSIKFFHIPGMEGQFDTRADVTGFNNGVIIVNKNVAEFCAGKPEDFVSKFSNIDYLDDMHWDHPEVIRLMKWLNQTFPDPELRDYFLRYNASFLKGINQDKFFMVYTGAGDNSKSMICKLVERTFGTYVCNLPISELTQKKGGSSSAPSPQLARLAGSRVVTLQEPSAKDKLNDSAVKSLTGMDKFYARSLHSNGFDIEQNFKIVMMCNDIPTMDNQNALKNRLRIIYFGSTWSDHAPESEAEQYRLHIFPKINDFGERIPSYTSAFLWVLVQYYTSYVDIGIRQEPECVKEHTARYWRDTDKYFEFLNTSFQAVLANGQLVDITTKKPSNPSTNAYIQEIHIYEMFKQWFGERYSYSIPSIDEARKGIKNYVCYGDKNRIFYGLQAKPQNINMKKE
jgi:hypothetical protein